MAATTQELLTKITEARNTLRNKGVDLGIATSTDKLETLATKYDAIENRGTVNAQVQEGEAYTIQPGYYKGGSVSGVSGGGNYQLQSKTVTPTKKAQNVTSDSGYYGLSDVQVNPIPDNYNDTSAVTAGAADVLANKVIVGATGETVAGTMTDNGAVSKTLDATSGNQSYTVPKGYHSGSGTVKITLEEKSATPTKSTQTITPATGKVLSKVTVAAIPAAYITTDDATALAGEILDGKTAYVDGAKVEGTMTNNGAVNLTIDGLTQLSATIPAGYTSGGTVTLTDDIYNQLAAI